MYHVIRLQPWWCTMPYLVTGFRFFYHARAKRRLFTKLRRYHTRPLRLNRGPGNVHFGKTHFRDPNINARIFYVLRFLLRYLKTAQKTVQSSKNAEK